MLWCYDQAICDDLSSSFNPNTTNNPVVKVFDPDHILDLVAQIKDDTITYPVVALQRYDSIDIDTTRTNFSRIHLGTSVIFDKETNNWYNEQVIPITMGYQLTILSANTADRDELVRELLFKYTKMYFLSITVPYESKRKIRFGVVIDHNTSISYTSGSSKYISSGQVYRTEIQLICQGCVLVNYIPIKLKRTEYNIETVPNKGRHRL